MKASASDNFFTRRWRGEVPLRVMLWRDMLGVGTLINVATGFLTLIAIVWKVDIGLAVALHFAPLPYNIFLFAAIWRAPNLNTFSAALSAGWLAVMTLL